MIAALVMAAPAVGQGGGSVTRSQYGDSAEQLGGGGRELPASGTDPAANVGSLPFTGLDLALMGAAAATLLAGGALMRRRLGGES